MVLCVALALSVTYPVAATAASSSLPKVMMFTTHGMGTKYYTLASGLGKVLSSHLKTEIKVMPTTGPGEWMPMIQSGEVDLGIANAWDSRLGFLADGNYEKPLKGKSSKIRLLTSGSSNKLGVLVAETSGIAKYQDLKNKRYVGLFTGSVAATALAEASLANFGFSHDDVKMISMTGIGAAGKALNEGRADAMICVLGAGFIAQLDAGRGARFISYDMSPEAVKRFQAIFPAEPLRVEPGKGKLGVKEPVTFMKYDSYFVARANLTEEAAYQIVKVLWDYNEELGPIHVSLKSWTPDVFVIENPSVPYHPGAIKFYKEKGVWHSTMDKIQQELLAMEK